MLFNAADNPKIAPFSLGDRCPYLTMVHWAHLSQPPNSFSIGSVAFAGLTNVTNRQTDRPTMAFCV